MKSKKSPLEAEFGVAKAEAKAGFTFTKYDSGEIDTGVKAEVTATLGGAVRAGF